MLLVGLLAGCGGEGQSRLEELFTTVDQDGDGYTLLEDCDDQNASFWRVASSLIDADLDGLGAGQPVEVCRGDVLPAGYSDNDGDCDDSSADHYRLLPFGAADRDGDGYRSHESGEVCSGVELAEGFFEAPDGLADCDDLDVARWRFATTYADGDGDGIGSGPGTVSCIGANAGSGHSLYGYDPLDDPSDPDSLAASDFDLPIYLFTDNDD